MSDRGIEMLSAIWPFVFLFFAGGGIWHVLLPLLDNNNVSGRLRLIGIIAMAMMVAGFLGMHPWIAPPEFGGMPL
jgi:hypothetical protein